MKNIRTIREISDNESVILDHYDLTADPYMAGYLNALRWVLRERVILSIIPDSVMSVPLIDYEDKDIYPKPSNYGRVSNTNTKRRTSKSTAKSGKTCTT